MVPNIPKVRPLSLKKPAHKSNRKAPLPPPQPQPGAAAGSGISGLDPAPPGVAAWLFGRALPWCSGFCLRAVWGVWEEDPLTDRQRGPGP
jgi:hypothetical protein